MKLTLLLVSVAFLASCTMPSSDTASVGPRALTQEQAQKDLGGGWSLSRTDEATTLTYSGRTVRVWEHATEGAIALNNKACEAYKNIPMEYPTEADLQAIWSALPAEKQKECISDSFFASIEIRETPNPRFVSVIIPGYYSTRYNLVDTVSGNIYENMQETLVEIAEDTETIIVHTRGRSGDNDVVTIFTGELKVKGGWTEPTQQFEHSTIKKLTLVKNPELRKGQIVVETEITDRNSGTTKPGRQVIDYAY